jgi:hypothetical protein
MMLGYTNLVTISAIFIVFSISGTQTLNNVEAQQQGIPQMPQQPEAQPPQLPFSNFTASIPLASSLFDVMKSKISVNLADAMTNVTNTLGPNATALSASIQPERGFLVYRIVALDTGGNIHLILVDPANGSTLLQQQFPAAMSEEFSSIPGVGPTSGSIPGMRVP